MFVEFCGVLIILLKVLFLLQEENKENIIFHHFAAKNLQGGSQIVFHRLFGEIQLFGYLLDGDMFLPA